MSVSQPPKISSNFDVLFYRHSFWIQLDDFVSLRLPILVWKSFLTSQKNRRLVTFLTRSIVPDLMTMNQLHIAPVSRNVGKKSKKSIIQERQVVFWIHILMNLTRIGGRCWVRRTLLEDYLESCEFCKEFSRFTNKPPVTPIVYNYPNERWQIDLKDHSDSVHDGFRYVRHNYYSISD